MLRTSQIVAGTLLVPYVACGAVLCLLVLDRRHCNSPFYLLSNNQGRTFTPTSTKSTTSKSFTLPKSTKSPKPRTSSKSFASTTSTISSTSPVSLTSSISSTSTKFATAPGIYDDVITHDKTTEQSFEDEFCAGGYHGLWSLMGTLVMGFSIVVFRLFIGTRVGIVKYVHLILHLITLVLFGIGLWCIFTNDYSITYDRINYHGLTSWVVLATFCVQFVIAITKLRSKIAFFHDFIGIWIFMCCVSCCISGKSRAQRDYGGINQDLFYGLSYVCFTCILVVILSPFFEWDMVGPL